MSGVSSATTDAPAPFSGAHSPDDDMRAADFILRSSDSVDSHVHKDTLRLFSDFFDGMFSLPAGNGGILDLQKDGKTVLFVPEPAKVLSRLLSFVYPPQSARPYTWEITVDDLEVFLAVQKAAEKYQFLRVEKLLAEMLDSFLKERSDRQDSERRLWALMFALILFL
ncbi:hypothetical protein C8R43DRAFT_1053027 [Mycena crocata]|nr:hypothetical protein C8R43DRAFT_1053027 [Mycena crocata]